MRIYSDDAVPTTVASAAAGTVTLADATGWPSPTGGDDATFRAVADGVSLRYSGRSGAVLSGVTRLDGSAMGSLTVGGDARHYLAGEDMGKARALRETSGPTTLAIGAVADGQRLARVGGNLVGVDAAGLFPLAMQPGIYYDGSLFANGGSQAFVANNIYVCPIYLASAATLDRIGLQVAVASAAGALARLGIYAAGAHDLPTGDLLLNAGTIPIDVTGFQEITISQALSAGVYYLAAQFSTATGNIRSRNAASAPTIGFVGKVGTTLDASPSADAPTAGMGFKADGETFAAGFAASLPYLNNFGASPSIRVRIAA